MGLLTSRHSIARDQERSAGSTATEYSWGADIPGGHCHREEGVVHRYERQDGAASASHPDAARRKDLNAILAGSPYPGRARGLPRTLNSRPSRPHGAEMLHYVQHDMHRRRLRRDGRMDALRPTHQSDGNTPSGGIISTPAVISFASAHKRKRPARPASPSFRLPPID